MKSAGVQNQVVLTASLVDRGITRVGPTGHPVMDCTLRHQSEVEHAGGQRRLAFVTQAKAVGHIVTRLQALTPGQVVRCQGFLAPRRAARPEAEHQTTSSGGLIFYITDFELENQNGFYQETL
ncbi:MAG: primosomal replication protein [Pseudomonadota bacterium]|jgi:primosomal replication protein N